MGAWSYFWRCRALHFTLLSFMKFLSICFSSLSRSFGMSSHSSGPSTFPKFCTIFELVEGAIYLIVQVFNEHCYQLLGYTTSDLLPNGVLCHNFLSLAVQQFTSLPAHLAYLSLYLCHEFVCEDVIGDSFTSLTKDKQHPLCSLEAPDQSSHCRRLVKYVFLFINLCWLFRITFLSFLCLENISMISCSITCPETEVSLAGL